MKTKTRSYVADDFTFRMPLEFAAGAVDMSAAVVEVVASKDGGPVLVGVGMMYGTDEVRGRFNDNVFAPGIYRVQVRCTLGGDTQTVAEWSHEVLPSLTAAV